MSDEEKKVIEYFKRRIANKKTAYTSIYFKIEKLDALINLIDKQSKEIEELKEERKKYPIAMNDEQYKKVIELAQKDIKEELDRQINTKIEECENKIKKIRSKKLINEPEDTIVITRYAHYISILQSLLEKE